MAYKLTTQCSIGNFHNLLMIPVCMMEDNVKVKAMESDRLEFCKLTPMLIIIMLGNQV